MGDIARDDTPAPAKSALAALWAESRPLIQERIGTLEAAAAAVLEGHLDADLRRRAEREAHKLAGSLGVFGFHRGSQLAREAESVLQGHGPLSGKAALALAEAADDLTRELEGEPCLPAAPEPGGERELLLVVGLGAESAQRVVEEATAQGLDAAGVPDVDAARAAITRRRPALLLLEPAVAADLALVSELSSSMPDAAVVVVADPARGVDRLAVARAPAAGFLERGASPRAMVEALLRARERVKATATVLVVDDDPSSLLIVQAMLAPSRFWVVGLDDPHRFWDTLDDVRPDVLVLDYDMPGIDGVDLCRMVRHDETWGRLPVVFLTATEDDDVVRAIYAAGADDHLTKPVNQADLVTRLTNRLQRSRSQRPRGEPDPETGLPAWSTFAADAERLLALARRYARPLTLALLRVDNPPGAGRDAEVRVPARIVAALARLVRPTLQAEDAAGVDDSRQRLALMFYGRSPTEAVERLARVLEALRSEAIVASAGPGPWTASGGVARYPDDGSGLRTLVEAAGQALERARQAGGDRVRMIDEGTDRGPDQVDVLVVDDDEALGPLLVHALTTRGYRTLWLQDGEEAAALLTRVGPPPARVVLLDVGLPGLDGLAVLRALAERGALRNLRVIMVTLRSTETEVLEALELGAYDHVAKPFSVPVLLQRVGHALDSLPA